jgi:uncharacterized membrane protein
MKIAIDPDVDKSGIAILENNMLTLKSLLFFELFDFLKTIEKETQIVIEASWLKSYNWTTNAKKSISNNIANRVGANHEAGKKIVEMCYYLGLCPILTFPLKKVWSKGKISNTELLILLKTTKIQHTITKTNQEERDAALLVICK